MTFAIIETGGKQYIASKDGVQRIETIEGAKVGSTITFDKVLLTDDGKETKVGEPYVSGAQVTAEVVAEGRAPKVTVIQYKQKSRYFKKKGHRQEYLTVKFSGVTA